MTARLSEVWMAGRMLGWLVVLPVLKRMMPLPALASMMWSRRASRRMSTASDMDRMWRIARWLAVHAWPRNAGTCLEQSLILYRFLSARRASPELVIGVRRHNETVGAHAWVIVDGQPVGDSMAALAEFAPVVSFGRGGAPSTNTTLAPGLL
jgi:hypothetical protein